VEKPFVVLNQARQGDVILTRIEKIPESVKKLDPEKNGGHIIAHSETGHHHVIRGGDFFMLDAEATIRDFAGNVMKIASDGFNAFLNLDKDTELQHLKAGGHKPQMYTKGQYLVTRGRELRPQGWARAAD